MEKSVHSSSVSHKKQHKQHKKKYKRQSKTLKTDIKIPIQYRRKSRTYSNKSKYDWDFNDFDVDMTEHNNLHIYDLSNAPENRNIKIDEKSETKDKNSKNSKTYTCFSRLAVMLEIIASILSIALGIL